MNRRKLLLATLTIIAATSILQGTIKAHANTPPPWTASLDAHSTSPTDATIDATYNPHGFVSIGVIINASTTYPVNNVYGWQFGMIYDNATDQPAGTTLRASVQAGAQTGTGNPDWAGYIAGNNALFEVARLDIDPTHQEILVGFTLIGSEPEVTIGPVLSPSVQGNLLASVNFTITQTNPTSSFGLLRKDLVFVNRSAAQIPNIGPGVDITENQVAFPDFTLTPSPSSMTIPQGRSQSSIISVASKANFTGTISLSANPPTGITTSFNPGTVTPPENGAATATLNFTVSASETPGTYPIIVTGSNGTTTHTSTMSVRVVAPDFNITTSASYISLAPGLHGTITVIIASLYSFSGNVSLGISGPSPGPAVTPTPRILQIALDSSQAASLNITTIGLPASNYTITITAQGPALSGGTIAHSTTLVVVVTSPSSGISFLTILIVSLIAIVGIVAAITYLAKRKKRPTNSKQAPQKTVQKKTRSPSPRKQSWENDNLNYHDLELGDSA